MKKLPDLPHGLEPTWIARYLFNSMREIHDSRGIAIFSGPPGIGKTTSIEAFSISSCHVLHITASPRTRELALLRHIKEALSPHIALTSGSGTGGAYLLQQNLARDMRQFAREHGGVYVGMNSEWSKIDAEERPLYPKLTIVIDEAQYLQREAIEHLLFLNDAMGFPFPVGLIIIGNDELSLKADMDGTSQISAAMADRARISHKFYYSDIEDEDILLLLGKAGIACTDARHRLLAKLRTGHHAFSFRTVERAARLALELADGLPVAVDTIEKIHV